MKLKSFLPICLALAMIGCSSDDDTGLVSSCPIPINLTVTNITDTAADLYWIQTAETATYDVEFGLEGFTFSGEPTDKNISKPFSVTNLMPETNYEFYVRTNCKNGNTSDWAGPFAFSTSAPINYFPLTVGNSWSYNNERTADQQPSTQSQETMTVAGSSEENGNTYYELDTDNSLEGGLVTNILSNGELTKINGELIYTGNYAVEIPNFDPVQLPINATIYSKTANEGTELTNASNTVQQDIDVQGQSIPVTLNYNFVTTNEKFLPAFTINGEKFEDVLQANLLVSASIKAAIGPIEVTLLAGQDVVWITNYYADGVGLIHSEATINYEFEDLSSYGIPTIPDLHIESSQEIDLYNVVLD